MLKKSKAQELNKLKLEVAELEGKLLDYSHALAMMEIDRDYWKEEAERNINELKNCHRLMDKMRKFDPDKRL